MSNHWLPDADNTVQWDGKPGLSTASGNLVIGSALILVGVSALTFNYLTQAGVIASIGIGITSIIYGVVSVLRTEYVVTNQSIWKRTSLLGTDTTRVKTSDVQNVSYNRSAIGKFTGKGDVIIEVAGSDDIHFKRVTDYKSVHTTISNAKNKTQESTIPGSIDQWKAIREETQLLNKELNDT